MKHSKFTSLLITLCMVISMLQASVFADTPDIVTINENTEQNTPETPSTTEPTEENDYTGIISDTLEKIAASYVNKTDDWTVMDMGAYENFAPDTENKLTDSARQQYINSAIQTIQNATYDSSIDKAVLGLAAISKDPTLLYSINSNTPISAIDRLNSITKSTSAWTAPYTLAAYNQGDYDTDTYETEIVNALLENQEENGSWDEFGTIDTTGNVIAGLSFYNEIAEVNTAIENAVNYLSTQQNDDGTFSDSYSGPNANSTAMVVIGLSAAGVDLVNDTRFIKNDNNIVDGLLSFLVADGSGFGYTDNESVNPGATEQGFRALISCIQAITTEQAYNVYDFSSNELTPARMTGSGSSPSAPSDPDGDEITVKMTIKADTGYWLNNAKVTILGENATVYDAFVKACDANSITYVGAEKGYVSSMTKGNKTLAEFDKGPNSGWLYKVNGELPTVGLTDYAISDGDNIVWYYTEDWAQDPSAKKYNSGGGYSSLTKTQKAVKADEALSDTAKYIYETVKDPQVSSIGGEWAVLGLARGNSDIPKEYFDTYYENLKKALSDNQGILHDTKYTEYSRAIIALTSIGKNPLDVAGYNLISPLTDYENTVKQGINGAIFALIALDCGNYMEDSSIRDKYIEHILDNQKTDGGFTMSGDISDIDTTAMAITALSNYQDNEKVKTATEKALNYISKAQLNNGGFESQGIESSESSSQVIVALCELGIDINDTRFVKSGKTVLDNLLSYYSKGNGFKHLANDNKTNQMATEQALYALVALNRLNNKKTSLYDMSDVEKNYDAEDSHSGLPSKSKHVKKLPVINKGKTFSDINNSSKKKEIEALAERGMINGRSDSEFAPAGTMTRAEFAAIIVKSLGLDFTGENIFTDVSYDSWYIEYVSTAYAHGIIKGISENEFNPEGTITKEESAVMVQRAAKLCGMTSSYDDDATRDILAGFVDYVNASDWAKESLAFCYDNGILPDSDMEILPNIAVVREDIASMLYNVLEKSKLL